MRQLRWTREEDAAVDKLVRAKAPAHEIIEAAGGRNMQAIKTRLAYRRTVRGERAPSLNLNDYRTDSRRVRTTPRHHGPQSENSLFLRSVDLKPYECRVPDGDPLLAKLRQHHPERIGKVEDVELRRAMLARAFQSKRSPDHAP
jgi:hypothetical protein